jgi:hypothetical protein
MNHYQSSCARKVSGHVCVRGIWITTSRPVTVSGHVCVRGIWITTSRPVPGKWAVIKKPGSFMYYFLSLAFSLNQLKTLNHMKTSLSGRFPRKALYKIYVFCVYVGDTYIKNKHFVGTTQWPFTHRLISVVFIRRNSDIYTKHVNFVEGFSGEPSRQTCLHMIQGFIAVVW